MSQGVIIDSIGLTDDSDTSRQDAMKQKLEVIQRQKAEVERELKGMEDRRVELEQWLRDLIVTERTLAKVLEVDLPKEPPRADRAGRRKKPTDIPSVYEMAVNVIRDRGEEFVEATEIVSAIKRRWWPNAANNDIAPSLWRLATKDGRLRKEGTRYALAIRSSEGSKMPARTSATA